MAGSRTRQGKYTDDPLVDLDSPRLRAAMEAGGWTVTRLAARLNHLPGLPSKEYPQTLHHLSRGEGRKRCRKSRRARLARALSVPEPWLAGQEVASPSPGELPVEREMMASPRASLAVGRLLDRCRDAIIRDLAAEPRPRTPGAALAPEAETFYSVMLAVGHLLSALRWRTSLVALRPPASADPLKALREPVLAPQPPLSTLHEAAVLGLAAAWEFILTPWLSGKAQLDYRRFRELAKILNPTVGAILPNNMPDPAKRDPTPGTSPYVAIDWPRDDAQLTARALTPPSSTSSPPRSGKPTPTTRKGRSR